MQNKIKIIGMCAALFFIASCATSNLLSDQERNSLVGTSNNALLIKLQNQGLYCTRMTREESDKRLLAKTDGTLNDVRLYSCRKESDGLFCVKHQLIYLFSQYDKLITVTPDTRKICITD